MSRTEEADSVEEPSTRQRVTVLMPVYNGERFLAEQLDSIFRQDVAGGVFVNVLDDGSEDGSLEILEEYAARYPQMSIMRHQTNIGLVEALNTLLDEVRTPYFALADQDDVWDSSKLRLSIDHLEMRRASMVYSDVRIVDARGVIEDQSYLSSKRIRPLTVRDPVPFVFRNPVIGHTIVAKVEVGREATPMPKELLYHEIWLVQAALSVGAVSFLPTQLGSYRRHERNVIGPHAYDSAAKYLRPGATSSLDRRQRTRAIALACLSSRDESIKDLASIYAARGFGRLVRLPSLFTSLRSRLGQLGPYRVFLEILLYALNTVLTGSKPYPPRLTGSRSSCSGG